MVNQNTIMDLVSYCKSIMTDEMILQWKRDFNKIADKISRADRYMDAPNVKLEDKDMKFLCYLLEVLGPFKSYLEVFQKLGIKLPEDPFKGYPEAK